MIQSRSPGEDQAYIPHLENWIQSRLAESWVLRQYWDADRVFVRRLPDVLDHTILAGSHLGLAPVGHRLPGLCRYASGCV
jgi:hypothetical protein